MSENTINDLVETRLRIIKQVENGELQVKKACELLSLSRPGLWKIRKRVREQGYTQRALIGNKRGPKTYNRAWNRTSEDIEDRVVELRKQHGVGPDRLGWLLEDEAVYLHRSTIYRILVRKGEHRPQEKEAQRHNRLYRKGYPGEEIQMDTTEPFGKGGPILISAIDDYSRWGFADLYQGKTSKNASVFLRECIFDAPFAIKAVRVDRGSEFHKDFIKTRQELGIEIIRNPSRTPRKNGKVERLHRTVEEECLWRIQGEQQSSGELVSYALTQHTMWYNSKRRHLGYKMDKKTPQQKIENWIINNQPPIEFTKEVDETLILYISCLRATSLL